MDHETEQDNTPTVDTDAAPPGAIALVCAGIKADGTPCEADPLDGELWCWNHHPGDYYVEQRKRNGIAGNKIAGRGRPARTIEYRHIKQKLADLIEKVDTKGFDTKRASVQGYLYDVLLRAIKQEEEAEAEEVRDRLDALEEQMERKWVR